MEDMSDLKNMGANLTAYYRHWQFGSKKQLAFLEDLFTLINDGIPANRAVEMMAQVSEGLTREVALTLSQKISEGQPLAEGMKEWFNPNVIEIIRVGEAGGALAQTLSSAIKMLSQQGVALGAFIGALLYPLIVIVMACAIILYLDTAVFTQFRAIKPESEWPEAGRRLVWIAGFIRVWWWMVIVGIVAVVIILGKLMRSYTGEFRPLLDDFPPFSFYRRLAAARVLETMGLLVSNGVVFRSAIRIMQMQATPYMSSHLLMMEHLLSTGKTNIADVLATGLVSDHDLMRLRVMAEVKGFEQIGR